MDIFYRDSLWAIRSYLLASPLPLLNSVNPAIQPLRRRRRTRTIYHLFSRSLTVGQAKSPEATVTVIGQSSLRLAIALATASTCSGE
jgi:hypothetical protein